MKKVLLSLLAVIVVLGLFAATGYAGYRIGYAQGAQAKLTTSGTTSPGLQPFGTFAQRGTHRFGFERGFGRGGFPMPGFGFFSPLVFFARIIMPIVILALVVWFVYWLFTRSGWRLIHQPVAPPPPAESSTPKVENE